MRGRRAAARTGAGLCVAAVALAGCGAEQASRSGPRAAGGDDPVGHPSTPPTDAVVASHGLVLQVGEGAVLCNGDIAESAPPQCTGPTIASWDWEDAENAGLDITDEFDTWWADDVWVVGTFDGDIFTPTEPPSAEPPEGLPAPDPVTEPADCEDPLRGADIEIGDAEATDEAMRLAGEAEGFIGNRISGDGSRISVALQSRVGEQGADTLLKEIREVYSGPVCLELRDGPSAAELDEIALSMRTDDAPWTEVIGSDGSLLVRTEVVDAAARDLAREQVAGRVDDDAIHLTGRYYVLDDDVEGGEGAEETGQAAGGDAYPLEVAPGDELGLAFDVEGEAASTIPGYVAHDVSDGSNHPQCPGGRGHGRRGRARPDPRDLAGLLVRR